MKEGRVQHMRDALGVSWLGKTLYLVMSSCGRTQAKVLARFAKSPLRSQVCSEKVELQQEGNGRARGVGDLVSMAIQSVLGLRTMEAIVESPHHHIR